MAEEHSGGQIDEGVVAFGPFRLDPLRRALTRDGASVALGDRAFDILTVLIKHAPGIASKAALFEQVWPGTFVDDSALRYHISALRKALGDDGDEGRYIRTVSGRGYCLVAPLSHGPGRVPAQATKHDQAPVATLDTNLPARLSAIIGRERELAELARRVEDNRLNTVVGPGGVGKTRLAVELGLRVLAAFPAGVWLIDLAPANDRSAAESALASALGIAVPRSEAALISIIAALRRSRMLLIFDNCEHLAEVVAALIKALLEHSAAISILATSQKSLQLEAECIYALDPLEVPPIGTAEIAGYPAVAFFTRQVRIADRRFELHADNSASVGAICRQLDGLPLALEMAAGRLRMFGVEGLRRGLDDRLKILKRSTEREARHASLHGMLDWSHSLLREFDQTVFRRLSIFPNSFSLDGAVAVAADDEAGRWEVIDALGRLIDHSLVTVERQDPVRYRLLETLRFYATERLRDAGEADVVAKRHADHAIEIFEEADRLWEETSDAVWIARYQPEFDNYRAALDWALAARERRLTAIALAAAGYAAVNVLARAWDGRSYIDRVIPLADTDVPAAVMARVLYLDAVFLLLSGDPDALAALERAAALYRDVGDRPRLGRALVVIAQTRTRRGEVAQAKDLVEEARLLLAGTSFKRSRFNLTHAVGVLASHLGDLPGARRAYFEGLKSAREFSPSLEIKSLTNLALVEYRLGNLPQAIGLARESVSCLNFKNIHTEGDIPLNNLAAYLIAGNYFSEARGYLEKAFRLLAEPGTGSPVNCLRVWAALAGGEGKILEAAQLLGFVDADLERHGQVLDPAGLPLHNRLLAILEAGLSPAEFEALTAIGASWSDAEAIEFVANRLVRGREPKELAAAPAFPLNEIPVHC